MISRKELEAQERRVLAPYAIRACDSRGRAHREPEHPYRTCFQRDHDRIIHSTAFRRLEYKTQVFVIHEGDYYRTRLTHSLEVAQIAETIARSLRLNTELVRSIALAHDLGHGPFGHSGEDALKQLMQGHGGFDHNLQALRIVELLEERYPSFPGLNLTQEAREGLNKHRRPLPGVSKPPLNLSLEAQVVNVADEIAYDHHDLDDGLTSGLIREEDLRKIPMWREAHRQVSKGTRGVPDGIRRLQIIRRLINWRVTELIRETEHGVRRLKIRRPGDAQQVRQRVVAFSPEMERLRAPLKRFLIERLYHHHRVVRMADKAQRLLVALFEAYLRKPEQLPDTTRNRMKQEEPHRVVCDYLAGMTDRYAMEEYRKLFDPSERV